MIEINWGHPLNFVVSSDGTLQSFSTVEQVRYWLRNRWPIADDARQTALSRIQDAMDCICSVGTARRAFIAAARSAGFVHETLIADAQLQPTS
ncbi:DUF982 domain-containing protein [Albidovulum sediminis]|uniref:DUF982 domain-containing protein n=1 Tax=Albidovulum sediminis TaxID=3066345 RepID=A0ABT2NHF3_9RHOB|nr:DUF982 domain-containing protein [Defluviimonas sediminis]MCT8328345.1 DUF982 domain-containing protein [Defluviimonas sediminis]